MFRRIKYILDYVLRGRASRRPRGGVVERDLPPGRRRGRFF